MSVSSSIRLSRPRRLLLAMLLLAIAAVAWGVILYREHRDAPVQRHIQTGVELALAGQRHEAAREWLGAVRLDPRCVEGWKLLGEYYRFEKRWGEALYTYRQVQRYRPAEKGIAALLADCAYQAKDIPAARRYVEQALKENPNDSAALAMGQRLWSNPGEEAQRLPYLRRLVQLQPDNLDYRMMLVEVLTHELYYDEARPHLERILALDPNNAQAYAIRGFLQTIGSASAQAETKAEADLRRSLELDPNNPFALFQMARLCKRQGRLEEAIRYLERASRAGPDRFNIFYELALVYQQKGDRKRAAAARKRFEAIRSDMDRALLLEKRCVAYPDNFDYHLEYGQLLIRTGDYSKAEEALQKALALRPGDPQAKAALERLAVLAHRSSVRKE